MSCYRRAWTTVLAAATIAVVGAACAIEDGTGDDGGPVGTVDASCQVERVVDGDTLRVSCLDDAVRLYLIDTPELASGNRPAECYGEEAKAYLELRLPRGRIIELERGAEDTDQYGRYLRYLWLDGELLNETILREGYAERFRDSRERTYADRMIAAEQDARGAGRGLWGACR